MTEMAPIEMADQEPLLTRVFDAPREHVFQAWTDPDLVVRWWGPAGYDIQRGTVSIDPHVGGRYDLCMVTSDIAETFWVRNEILEIVAPDLLVLKSEPLPEIGFGEPIITRVQLEVHGGGTKVTFHRPYPAGRRAAARAGWNSSLDKLEALLGQFP